MSSGGGLGTGAMTIARLIVVFVRWGLIVCFVGSVKFVNASCCSRQVSQCRHCRRRTPRISLQALLRGSGGAHRRARGNDGAQGQSQSLAHDLGLRHQADHVLGRWRRAQRLHLRHRPDAGDELQVQRRSDDRAGLEGRLPDAHSGSVRQFDGAEPDHGAGQSGPQRADVLLVRGQQGARQGQRRQERARLQERRHVHRSFGHADHRQLRAVRRRQLLPAQQRHAARRCAGATSATAIPSSGRGAAIATASSWTAYATTARRFAGFSVSASWGVDDDWEVAGALSGRGRRLQDRARGRLLDQYRREHAAAAGVVAQGLRASSRRAATSSIWRPACSCMPPTAEEDNNGEVTFARLHRARYAINGT